MAAREGGQGSNSEGWSGSQGINITLAVTYQPVLEIFFIFFIFSRQYRLDGIYFNFNLHRSLVKAALACSTCAFTRGRGFKNGPPLSLSLDASLEGGWGEWRNRRAMQKLLVVVSARRQANMALCTLCSPVHELQLAREHRLVILWSRNGDENGIHRESMTNLSRRFDF